MAVLGVLLVIGVLVWLQGFIYRKRWNQHIGCSLSFSERYATEGDTLLLTEVITNRKLLPLPWLAVKFQVSRYLLFTDHQNAQISDDYYRNDLFNLMPYQRITRKLPFICGKRGFYLIKSAELVSSDILVTEKFAMPVSCRTALTVYPRTLDIDAFLTIHKQFLGQILTKRFIQPDPFEFKGIREYQPYDSLRSVNFKATAKTGQWMVNVNDYTVTQEIVLLLNLQPYSSFPLEALYEQTIRLAASLAAFYIGNGVPLSYISNARGVDLPVGYGSAETGHFRLESGSGAHHLNNINESLARIDLKKGVFAPGGVLLDELTRQREAERRAGREPAYILLSTYHEKDFMQAYAALNETGADVLWIIPVTKGMEVTVPPSERVVQAVMEL